MHRHRGTFRLPYEFFPFEGSWLMGNGWQFQASHKLSSARNSDEYSQIFEHIPSVPHLFQHPFTTPFYLTPDHPQTILSARHTECEWNVTWPPWLTCLSVRRAVYLRSLPSRRNSGCGLSRIINTMSDGILPLVWSPSFWNVTLVPDFQPGFTDMLTYLSSFFGVPSGCSTRLDIFIFFTQPLLISSSVTYKSCLDWAKKVHFQLESYKTFVLTQQAGPGFSPSWVAYERWTSVT